MADGRGVERLHVHLGQALAGAHDAAGVDGLVGADEHHGAGAGSAGGVGDVAGAERVGEQALAGVGLDDGDVLESGGVEDEVRADGVQQGAQAVGVADVGDVGAAGKRRVGLGDLEVDLPEGVFAVVQQDELRGGEGRDLAAEFGADGAAGAGNEDAAAGDELGDGVAVERDLGAVEQVLDGDGGEFQRGGGRLEGGGAGGALDRDTGGFGFGEEGSEVGARQVGVGQDDGEGQAAEPGQAGQDGPGVGEGAEDGLAVDAAAGLVRRAGEQADDAEALPGLAVLEGAEEEVRTLAGAGEEDGFRVGAPDGRGRVGGRGCGARRGRRRAPGRG